MRISDWSSDVCSSDLIPAGSPAVGEVSRVRDNGLLGRSGKLDIKVSTVRTGGMDVPVRGQRNSQGKSGTLGAVGAGIVFLPLAVIVRGKDVKLPAGTLRSEEHTSELQSLMRISYAVFCLKKKTYTYLATTNTPV